MKLSKLFLLFALVIVLAAATKPAGYSVGDTVEDFKLKNVDGKSVALSDFTKQKGAIVIFDCNTCPYSKAYNARIIALNEKFAAEGFPVIAINSNDPEASPGDSFDEMTRIAREKKYTFPYLIDENQSVAKAFGATNTPHAFVLKRDGQKFTVAYIGAIDNSPRDEARADKKYIEDAVNELLQGKTVTTSKTKAIGCGIKWKDA